MNDSPPMDHQTPDHRGFVEHWRRVGPMLERVQIRELQQFDRKASAAIIDALLQIGVDRRRKRTTSGLVELHRRLRKGYLRRSIQHRSE